MNRLSPKIEIINHFDSLINRVDIDIEKSLKKYKEEQVLGQLNCFDIGKRNFKSLHKFSFICYNPIELEKVHYQYQTVDEFSESTKVVDYLNQIRKRTIEELTKAQKDTLEYYKQNLTGFKSNENKMDEIRSEIFKDKFYFQVLYKANDAEYSRMWIFNLYTFVTDFYMSPNDIQILETLINSFDKENDSKIVFNEKTVLIGLLCNHFFENLNTQKFPSHVIIVRKEDLLNIKQIFCKNLNGVNLTAKTIDLSNLEELGLYGIDPAEIKIEELSSLKQLALKFKSLEQVIITNMLSLERLDLSLKTRINSEVLSKFIEYLPNIEILDLSGDLSYFSLDILYNLKSLKLDGSVLDDFNFQLFDNLCNQLEYITISGPNIDNECFAKLFFGRNFPYLRTLFIRDTTITKLEKTLFVGFQMLKSLVIYDNKKLLIIDNDAFSNLKKLSTLALFDNCLENIEENAFSSLQNLEFLALSKNQLTSLDPKSFVGLGNLKKLYLRDSNFANFDLGILDNFRQIEEIDLSGNPIINKEEISNLFVSSKVKFIF